MRLPTIRDTIVCKSSAVKTKWDIIHAAILMLSTEESLTEQSGRHVLEFILFLHVKVSCDIVCDIVLHCMAYTDHFYNSCAMLEQTNRVQLEASACLFWRFQTAAVERSHGAFLPAWGCLWSRRCFLVSWAVDVELRCVLLLLLQTASRHQIPQTVPHKNTDSQQCSRFNWHIQSNGYVWWQGKCLSDLTTIIAHLLGKRKCW